MTARAVSCRIATAVATALLIVSCGGDSSTEPTPNPQPAQVQVTPGTVTLTSAGATQQLSATVRDGQGNIMSGASVNWSSSNQTAATVSSTGLVTAEDEGSSTITATSGTASGTANVTVEFPAPVPASVEITPSAVTLTSAGGTAELTAVVRDAGGAAIPGASVTWSSSSEGVATVSPATGAVITVTAVTSGTSNVTATSAGAQATIPVTVDLPPAPFITTWQVESDYLEIIVPTTGGGYNYNLYWENTANPTQNGTLSNVTGNAVFTVPAAGTYRVEISGQFPRIHFFPPAPGVVPPRNSQIRTVEQWGDIEWVSMERAFQSTQNLTVTATDAPNLTGVTSLRGMFARTDSFNGAIGHWNTDNITTMQTMFWEAVAFNQPINHNPATGAWNTGNVTNMQEMFEDAIAFNQDLDQWDVSQVTNMREMFNDATAFNGDVTTWNTGNVTTMNQMFDGAAAFNQDIGGWNVSNVTQFGDMFENAVSFNQDIGGWDTSSATSMFDMLRGASSFDQNLGAWDLTGLGGINPGRMLDNSGMSVESYDATLIGWAATAQAENAPKNLNFIASNLTFCDGAAARQSLISDHGWTITDGGVAAGCAGDDGGVIDGG
jgi:surface protein